jgi:hypothetical protein
MVYSEAMAITAVSGLYLLSLYYAAAAAVTKNVAINTFQKSLAPFLHQRARVKTLAL